MKKIVQSFESMGTAFGWGYWSSYRDCEQYGVYNERDIRHGLSGIEGFDVGSCGHALLGHYYNRGKKSKKAALAMDTSVIEWTDPGDVYSEEYRLSVLGEADRCFRAYRLEYPPDDLGKVRNVEKDYRVENFLGLGIPFTFRPDLETGTHPTYTLVDHKFYAFATSEDQLVIRDDLRYPAYQMGFEAFTGIPPELVVNVIYKTKPVSFLRVTLKYPNKRIQTQVFSHLKICRDLRQHALTERPQTNINHCRRWGQKPCIFIQLCERN